MNKADNPLSGEGISSGSISVRLAQEGELEAVQRLRYDVFYREYGATPISDMEELGRDYDDFDSYAEHLVVIDSEKSGDEAIIGTYRMLRSEVAAQLGQFYTDDEFDISCLRNSGMKLLELGRSCVHKDYRTKPVLQLLWQGIAAYLSHYDIEMMFGCASFQGTNVQAVREELSYLYHYHRAPEELCPHALESLYVPMNHLEKDAVDVKRAMLALPPLLKSYIRIGCVVGEGAIIDHQFNTIDVCILLPTEKITDRYSKHFGVRTGRSETPVEAVS